MLRYVISDYDRLGRVRSFYDRLKYDSSGWVRLYEVSTC